MKGEQAFVAVIESGNSVKFRSVVPADSDGKAVRISSGLKEGEQVVLNPGFGISDNEHVQPVKASEK
jgi:multidrug efflux pump subunit AcrA (membrane-fusion protein)